MATSMSKRIYQAFFAELSTKTAVSAETRAALQALLAQGNWDEKGLKNLIQALEERHAQD